MHWRGARGGPNASERARLENAVRAGSGLVLLLSTPYTPRGTSGRVHLLLYNLGLVVAFVLALPHFAYRRFVRGRAYAGWRARSGRLPASLNPQRARTIWVHAVSVGEVLAARPLLAKLKARFPALPVLVSTTTVAGQELAFRGLPAADGVFYAPFDTPGAVRRTLEAVNPALLVLMETELWPNLIAQAHGLGTRIAVVNGRISPRSFPRYRRVRRLLAPTLAQVDLFLMQAETHAARAREIGAPVERVRVAGNLKYDGLGDGRPSPETEALLRVNGHPLWVAGSTVDGEEEHVLAAFGRVRANYPAARLVIAPRHPERFDAAAAIVAYSGFGCVRRTALGADGWRSGDVLVLDTIGELASLYAVADVVFVGGSLVPKGGHNVLEAAVAGKAVVVGPHMENFREIANDFLAEEALVQVASPADLAGAIIGLLGDSARREAIGQRARAIVKRNLGAVDQTVAALASLLP